MSGAERLWIENESREIRSRYRVKNQSNLSYIGKILQRMNFDNETING